MLFIWVECFTLVRTVHKNDNARGIDLERIFVFLTLCLSNGQAVRKAILLCVSSQA